MGDHPILFSGHLVRAILDGRKTVTRRPVRESGHCQDADAWCWDPDRGMWESGIEADHGMYGHGEWVKCPFGRPGDRLWVRETWATCAAVSPSTDAPLPVTNGDRLIEEPTTWVDEKGRTRWRYDGKVVVYRATTEVEFCDGDGFMGDNADRSDMPRWRPSIHMPRWASRLTLEVLDVRVERLQSITEEDAAAEGMDGDCPIGHIPAYQKGPLAYHFAQSWDAIYGKGPHAWDANPWVWRVEFRKVEP